jgi:phage tail protein X
MAVVTNKILEANSGLAFTQSAILLIIGCIVSKSF